ncbi:uncharacterized protein LOC109862677 [Pseudomyrmex gracilis]|uniref:uncharacterized protein LOC109862677 n=1 Tax=Pseudomyrmex gracilis TaxID=219809 RepID=UPI000994EC3E|nr:uncharacterized protein LOC109862677 [Pseudomyrmex gracilis]
MAKVLQINVNRSSPAQDLAIQAMREREVALMAISEPWRIPDSPLWAADLDGVAAVTWLPRCGSRQIREIIERGHGFVAVRWGNVAVFSCYFSPNTLVVDFEASLGTLGDSIRRAGSDLVISMLDQLLEAPPVLTVGVNWWSNGLFCLDFKS